VAKNKGQSAQLVSPISQTSTPDFDRIT